jgi:hypothetical protein
MALIREGARSGNLILLPHAIARGLERSVAVADVAYALINGWHEADKDEFRREHQAWNYAVRGSTIDRHQVRIVVSFDENRMLVITVIRLAKERK